MEPQEWTAEDEQHWEANKEWYSRRLMFYTSYCGYVSDWLREMRGERDSEKLKERRSHIDRILDLVHDEDYEQALKICNRIDILSVEEVEREYLNVCDNWHSETCPDGPTISDQERRKPIDWNQKLVDLLALLQADPGIVERPDTQIAETLGVDRTTLFGTKAGTGARKIQATLEEFRRMQIRTPPDPG